MASISGKKTKLVAYFMAAFKQWFARSGKTQHQAALELGSSQGAINNLLSGERVPSVGQMEKIAKHINCDLLTMLLVGRSLLQSREKPNSARDKADNPDASPLPATWPMLAKLARLDEKNLVAVEQVIDLALLAQSKRPQQAVGGGQSQHTARATPIDTKFQQGLVLIEDIADSDIIETVDIAELNKLIKDLYKRLALDRGDAA